MKKKFFTAILFVLCFSGSVFAQDASEIALYSEINTYINTRYYPGVIEKAEEMELNFPESVFIVPSRLYKSEALIELGRYEEAEQSLEKVLPSMHFGNEDLDKCWFLFGKTQFYLKKYNDALQSFYNCCSVSQKAEEFQYYYPSVLFTGRIYYLTQDYEAAVPMFEYVIASGKNYDTEDYLEALQKLFISYNASSQYEKTVSLYQQLDADNFSPEVFDFLKFYAATAYEKTGDYLSAYNLDIQLINNSDKNTAVSALKNAYLISHNQKLNVNTSEIFEKIKENDNDSASLFADFWTRLGIDAYNLKDFKKARECFKYAEENNSKDAELVIKIYEYKMQIDEGLTLDQAKKQAPVLQALEPEVISSKINGVSDAYYSVVMRYRAVLGDWKAVKNAFDKIVVQDDESLYYGASAYYKEGNYAEAESIIKDCKLTEASALYANILGRQGRNSEAAEIYVSLNASRTLSDEDRLEFAKVLYNQKKYDAAYKHAKSAAQPLSPYLCGICSIKTGNWTDAITQLENYLKKYAGTYGFSDEAFFYKSLAEYKNGDYQKAYEDFEYFGNLSTPNISLTRRAYSYGAKSAVMLGDFEKAAVEAEKLTRISFTQADKQQAVVFCAEIYTDSGDYDKAIKILEPYTLGKSDFALKTLFQTAEIYEKKGDYEKTDSLYQKISSEFPKTREAEESLYRRGELYLSRKNYSLAEARFTDYLNSYPDGSFADAACYYCGDCDLQLKNYSKSVMQNKTLLSKYPDSSFVYGAMKNLLEAYYAEEKYGEALTIAQEIQAKYPSQSVTDGVNKREIELEKIVGGTDRHIVEKLTEYEKNGCEKTKKGRAAGSELVQLYAVYGSREDAFNLASVLIPLQTGTDELYDRAMNCDFSAAYYRENLDNRNAASMYLKAAEYYRSSGKDKNNKAAAALYSAVDAFVSENMTGDAEETANLLIKLYPSTRQAQNVKSLLK